MTFIEIKSPFRWKINLSQIKFKFPATERWEDAWFFMNKLTKKWALGSKNFTSEGQKSPKNSSGSLALILKKIQKAIFRTLK